MNNVWRLQFREVWDRALTNWRAGRRSPATLLSPADAEFLQSIGCTPQELFDCVDDFQLHSEPTLETALAVAAIRRDYFLRIQAGRPTGRIASPDCLPPKRAQVDGIVWLPRLIAKARLKLRGELPPDIMYGCGGDRPFLRSVNLSLPEFLQLVWDAGDDDRRIIETVKHAAASPAT